MNTLNDDFKDAAQVYAERLKAQKESAENKRKTTAENADAFANYIEQQINEQRANGMRLDINNL